MYQRCFHIQEIRMEDHTTMTATGTDGPSRPLRSIGAVLAGFIVVLVLSTGTDLLMCALGVFPPSGQPLQSPGLFLLATGYRIVFTLLGGYVTAWLAPRNPARHALWLGLVGILAGALGVIADVLDPTMGPLWYPIALLVTGPPSAWIGGILRERWSAAR
jgi:hypothetical protein